MLDSAAATAAAAAVTVCVVLLQAMAMSPGNNPSLLISDYSFNAPINVDEAGSAFGSSSPFLGDTSNNLPTGFLAFTEGPWAPKCVVRGWVASFAADETRTISIDAKSFDGSVYEKGDADFKVVITGKIRANGVESEIKASYKAAFCNSGSYTASYSAAPMHQVGTYTVSVMAGEHLGWHLPGSPHTVVVKPAPTDPGHSISNLNSVQRIKAGSMQTVTVVARDVYGNLRNAGGDVFNIKVTQGSGACPGSQCRLYSRFPNAANGQYRHTYTVTQAGSYRLAIVLANENGNGQVPVQGSPMDLLVRHAEVDSKKTTAVAAGAETVDNHYAMRQQSLVLWHITAKDKFGNVVADRASTLKVLALLKFSIEDGGGIGNKPDIQGPTLDESTGVFSVSFIQNFTDPAADYSTSIKFNGAEIGGSPFRVAVVPIGVVLVNGTTVTQTNWG